MKTITLDLTKEKYVPLDWKSFISGENKTKTQKEKEVKKDTRSDIVPVNKAVKWGLPVYIIAEFPAKAVMAAGALAGTAEKGQAWNEIFHTVIEVADWLCVGVIIFAGAVWMFGNRSKALEMLIGAASGYLVIRHATDFQRWLAGI